MPPFASLSAVVLVRVNQMSQARGWLRKGVANTQHQGTLLRQAMELTHGCNRCKHMQVVKLLGPEGFAKCLKVDITQETSTWELDTVYHSILSYGCFNKWLVLHKSYHRVQGSLPASSSFVCGVARRVLPFWDFCCFLATAVGPESRNQGIYDRWVFQQE